MLIICQIIFYRTEKQKATIELPPGRIGSELRLYMLWTSAGFCAMMDFREKTLQEACDMPNNSTLKMKMLAL